jgi:repressor LexA
MRPALTARQRQAPDYITAFIDERGYPPTFREIAAHMGIQSTNAVNDHLKALERKGYLTREDLKSRALRPVDETKVSVPILEHVAANQLTMAMSTASRRVTIDRYFIGKTPPREVFGMAVRGHAMDEDGIFDGDYIFVRKQSTAENGEIVVVVIDGMATFRRIYHEGDRIRLQPANSCMAPVYLHRSEFAAVEIIGKVVGVFRRLT